MSVECLEARELLSASTPGFSPSNGDLYNTTAARLRLIDTAAIAPPQPSQAVTTGQTESSTTAVQQPSLPPQQTAAGGPSAVLPLLDQRSGTISDTTFEAGGAFDLRAVGQVRGVQFGPNEYAFGTGTLISPNFVLTAAHVVEHVDTSRTIAPPTGAVFYVGGPSGPAYHSLNIWIEPGYSPHTVLPGFPGGLADTDHDLALIELDGSVPGITPIPLARTVPTQGENLVRVGFGQPDFGAKQWGINSVNFVDDLNIHFNQDTGAISGHGDSGGPDLLCGYTTTPSGSVPYCVLAGVISASYQSFPDAWHWYDEDTRVDTAVNWIESVVGPTGLSAIGPTLQATEVQGLTGEVAGFHTNDPTATPSRYSAWINWGDGSGSAGSVTTVGRIAILSATPPGGGASGSADSVTAALQGHGDFAIDGGHTYAHPGKYTITVSIADAANPNGPAQVVTSAAVVADAPLTATGTTVRPTATLGFSGALASFQDGNANGQAGDFKATIAWGDGTTSAGTVSPDGNGGFTVSGSHTYAKFGVYASQVTIQDVGGASVTASSSAVVTGYVLDAGGALWRYDGNDGALLSHDVRSFVLGSDAAVYALTKNADLLAWKDGAAPTVVKNVQSYAVASDGTPYVLQGDGTLSQGAWTMVPTSPPTHGGIQPDFIALVPQLTLSSLDTGVQSFALAGDGTLYELRQGGDFRSRPAGGTSFTAAQGVQSFATDATGRLDYLLGDGTLWQGGAGVTSRLDSNVASFTVGSDGESLIWHKQDGSVWRNANGVISQLAIPILKLSTPGGRYNGTSHAASASAIGVGGATVAGRFTFTYYSGSSATGTPLPGAPSSAGTYTVVADFVSSDLNYTGGSARATFTIAPAAVPLAPPPPSAPIATTGSLKWQASQGGLFGGSAVVQALASNGQRLGPALNIPSPLSVFAFFGFIRITSLSRDAAGDVTIDLNLLGWPLDLAYNSSGQLTGATLLGMPIPVSLL